MSDVSTAFLQSPQDLDNKRVLTQAMDEYGEPIPGKYWLLERSVYGSKDAPRQWYITLNKRLREKGFKPLLNDPCIFVKGEHMIMVYVDDFMTTPQSDDEVT